MPELQTKLNPTECMTRLRERSDPFWKLFGSKLVLISIRGQRFTGWKRIWYGNPFRTIMRARVPPQGEGSLVSMRFGTSRFARGFYLVWAGIVVLIGAFGIIQTLFEIKKGEAPQGAALFFIFPPIMLMFAWGIYRFCRWLGRDEERFLTDAIKSILDAG
jgi:hypothetical protein